MGITEIDPLDQLVRSAAPDVGWVQDSGRVDALLSKLAVDVAAQDTAAIDVVAATRLRRRRRRRLLVGPLLVGSAALTAAAGYGLWLDTSSAAFGQAVARYVEQAPLPPGTDTEAYIALLAEQGKGTRASISDTTTQSTVASYGVCAWLTAWQRRDVRHPGNAWSGLSIEKDLA